MSESRSSSLSDPAVFSDSSSRIDTSTACSFDLETSKTVSLLSRLKSPTQGRRQGAPSPYTVVLNLEMSSHV